MRLVCRLGGCGPAVVMRTGSHLGGDPAPLGPAPTLPVIAPAGASSATASARRGFLLPTCRSHRLWSWMQLMRAADTGSAPAQYAGFVTEMPKYSQTGAPGTARGQLSGSEYGECCRILFALSQNVPSYRGSWAGDVRTGMSRVQSVLCAWRWDRLSAVAGLSRRQTSEYHQ
jgi:hypothetical protein